MIAGHFGFAAGVKAREWRCPLWALMLATVWLDIVFVPLFLAGIETIEMVPGARAGSYGGGIIHADYTHSLVGALVLAAVFGGVFGVWWGRRNAIVLGLVAFSHWVLDLIVHRADMPILPANIGGFPKLGFGLWRLPLVSIGLELALVVGGAWLYWRAARAVAVSAGTGLRRANIAGGLALIFGIAVLAMDAMA
jgi:hypothetical protein